MRATPPMGRSAWSTPGSRADPHTLQKKEAAYDQVRLVPPASAARLGPKAPPGFAPGAAFLPARCMCKRWGYEEVSLPDAELPRLLDSLGNFVMALKALKEAKVSRASWAGQTLLRMYGQESRLWDNLLLPRDKTPSFCETVAVKTVDPQLQASKRRSTPPQGRV